MFVLISRTNFSINFVRDLRAIVRDFSAAMMQLNPGKRLKTNERDSGNLVQPDTSRTVRLDQVGAQRASRALKTLRSISLSIASACLTVVPPLSEAASEISVAALWPLQIACPVGLQVKEYFYRLRHISTSYGNMQVL